MAAFHFELVSPEKLVFSGDVEAVIVPFKRAVYERVVAEFAKYTAPQ